MSSKAVQLQIEYLTKEGADNPIFQELQAGGDLARASLAQQAIMNYGLLV